MNGAPHTWTLSSQIFGHHLLLHHMCLVLEMHSLLFLFSWMHWVAGCQKEKNIFETRLSSRRTTPLRRYDAQICRRLTAFDIPTTAVRTLCALWSSTNCLFSCIDNVYDLRSALSTKRSMVSAAKFQNVIILAWHRQNKGMSHSNRIPTWRTQFTTLSSPSTETTSQPSSLHSRVFSSQKLLDTHILLNSNRDVSGFTPKVSAFRKAFRALNVEKRGVFVGSRWKNYHTQPLHPLSITRLNSIDHPHLAPFDNAVARFTFVQHSESYLEHRIHSSTSRREPK